jgi:hypothetical protein
MAPRDYCMDVHGHLHRCLFICWRCRARETWLIVTPLRFPLSNLVCICVSLLMLVLVWNCGQRVGGTLYPPITLGDHLLWSYQILFDYVHELLWLLLENN